MKTAIVTGATRGIGRAITEKLLDEDYFVIGIYKKSTSKATEMTSSYKNLVMIQTDLAEKKEIDKCAKKVSLLTKKVDVLINNAGIYSGGNLESFAYTKWQKIINTNVTAKFYLVQKLLHLLKKSSTAHIINISSRYGFISNIEEGCLAYNITNTAVNILTLGLAQELKAHNIKVSEVIPTITNTDRFTSAFTVNEQQEIIKKGLLAQPEEIANLTLECLYNAKSGQIYLDNRVPLPDNKWNLVVR